MTDPKTNSILDEGNRLFLQGKLKDVILYYNKILNENPMYNITLYHKERILFSLEKYDESILCCNSILNDYLIMMMSYLINLVL
jgi:tetratricopeptide (TPR) repeat protein